MTGSGTWQDSHTKALALVRRMTLEEKINLTAGASSRTGCSGFIPPIKRLNFTGMCLSDAGNGLRNTDFVSSWPSGLHVGASWNKKLARERGSGMGGEFKIKGVNVLLGPVVGPAGRVLLGGRNWEGFSIDPYLAGSLVAETVSAIQGEGVITSTKHFIANEQETNRMPSGDVQSVSSNIDDRTMHELYLWPFQDAVRAGTGNIMCSYQRVNNSYGCANSKTLNGLLKTELGFQGFVVSDWGAQHAGVATALAGLDMTMPGEGFWGSELTTAVKNGSVPESRIDDMATRIIATWYQMGQDQDSFPSPGVGMPQDLRQPHKIVDARNSTFRQTLLDGAVEGHVLVKNINKSLPLKEPKLLSLFGYSAKNPDLNNPGGFVSPWTFGVSSFNFTEFQDSFIFNNLPTAESRQHQSPIAINGTIYSGGGSGATSQSLTVSPFDAIVQQAYEDGTALFWDFVSGTPEVNPMSDACLVFGNAYATEGLDRPSLRDDYTDGLIKHVADRCEKTIVVFHNAGVRLVDTFIDHPNVTAVIFAHLPGEMSGKALVELLYGKVNFSGKLPYTVAKNESDYGHLLGPDYADGAGGRFEKFPQSNFSEGVWVDYRWFDAKGIEPRYEFGFGLSYSSFEYSGLTVEKVAGESNGTDGEFPTGEVVEGGQKDLWDVLVKVTAEVENTGDVDGFEVAQLYISLPSSLAASSNSSNSSADSRGGGSNEVNAESTKAPVKQLRGFEKPFIKAGETAMVQFELTRRDLSVWDVEHQAWRLDRGTYTVRVGSSLRDLPLEGEEERCKLTSASSASTLSPSSSSDLPLDFAPSVPSESSELCGEWISRPSTASGRESKAIC
ncbi:putative glycoside hydrolase [Naviculisporaceae sp. PSN 640]